VIFFSTSILGKVNVVILRAIRIESQRLNDQRPVGIVSFQFILSEIDDVHAKTLLISRCNPLRSCVVSLNALSRVINTKSCIWPAKIISLAHPSALWSWKIARLHELCQNNRIKLEIIVRNTAVCLTENIVTTFRMIARMRGVSKMKDVASDAARVTHSS
jgi:hypothetical protein